MGMACVSGWTWPSGSEAAVEEPALRPLLRAPFAVATWAKVKIGPDLHARVGKVLYSLPWRHIGKTADVRVTAMMVQFFIGGELVKTHPRKSWGKQTDLGDHPPEKIAFHMRTPVWCRTQAAQTGAACRRVIGELLAENALYRLRSAQGVIGLADKHDPSRLEAACDKAIAAGDPSYRTIKGILAAGTEREQAPAAAGDGGAAAFLHGPASFANVVPMRPAAAAPAPGSKQGPHPPRLRTGTAASRAARAGRARRCWPRAWPGWRSPRLRCGGSAAAAACWWQPAVGRYSPGMPR